MAGLRIENGEVIDPAAGEDGARRTVHVRGGKIAADAGDGAGALDASGHVVMPAGVDIHTHLVAPPVAAMAREAGFSYGAIGYTAVVDPAVHPAFARRAHETASLIPQVDKALLAILPCAPSVLKALEKGARREAAEVVSLIVAASGALSLKLSNPGGEYLPGGVRAVHGLDEPLGGFGLTPRKIITGAAEAVAEAGLPHPLHLHMNNIGLPGNFKTALETIAALEGRHAHLAHLQFYLYGEDFFSEAAKVARAVNDNPNVTFDIGQVVFEPACAVTTDERLARRLRGITGLADKENGAEPGEMFYFTAPCHYRRESRVNSVQWAAGLELALLTENPWQVTLSTDHPNGGPFTAYPYIARLLMDAAFRREELSRIHPKAMERSALRETGREYSMYEIAVITRAAPARRLGLASKGSLAVGADADIAIYKKDDDCERMLSRPAWVIKNGEIVVKDGKAVKETPGRTLYTAFPPGLPACASGRALLEEIGAWPPLGPGDEPTGARIPPGRFSSIPRHGR